MPTRDEFLHECLRLMGTWYRWGGKDPKNGIDCSGVVTWALYKTGGPDLRQQHNSSYMFDRYPLADEPQPGDLAMYPRHVMVLLWRRRDSGLWAVMGASGGDSETTTKEIALARGARVTAYGSHMYRSDFRGFRSMELYLTKEK